MHSEGEGRVLLTATEDFHENSTGTEKTSEGNGREDARLIELTEALL